MHYLLFTTTHCPKCPEFKNFVHENVSFPGEAFDETHPEFSDKIAAADVTNAPTIIVWDEEHEVLRTSEIIELRDFLSNYKC